MHKRFEEGLFGCLFQLADVFRFKLRVGDNSLPVDTFRVNKIVLDV